MTGEDSLVWREAEEGGKYGRQRFVVIGDVMVEEGDSDSDIGTGELWFGFLGVSADARPTG